MMPNNFENWTNLVPREKYNEARLWSRMQLLFRSDPFVYSLAEPVQNAIIAAVIEEGTFLRYPETGFVYRAFRKMPYSNMWSQEFKNHLAGLFMLAFWPQGVPEDNHG